MTATNTKSVATTIHDAIEEIASAVESVHTSVADMPLEVLGEITPLKSALDEVRTAQARSIHAVYDLVRTVNSRVRRITTGNARR